jgi:hypothetical protein
LVFFITKYQPISGRDPNLQLSTCNLQQALQFPIWLRLCRSGFIRGSLLNGYG